MNRLSIVLKNTFTTDIITNSSSCVFITDNSKEVEAVEGIISSIYKVAYPNRIWSVDLEVRHFEKSDGWIEGYKDYYHLNVELGDICIFSTGDNTIPYGLYELLVDVFDAQRIHLG